jgi:2,4-dienoyl-CoA reductase-like NADH-dependent reductase (Old Yellow Enzyme family)
VEVHAANGYLIDQFLQDKTNRCTDRYGGSVENRACFLLEITDAVIAVWGADRIGVHLRPRGEEHDMGDSNPKAIFGYVAAELRKRRIAFVFVREIEAEDSLPGEIKRRFGGPVIANELMSRDDGERLIEAGLADAVAFGRDYIATPDLAERLQMGLPLNTPDKNTFYGEGQVGYTDYPRLAPRR